MPHKTFRAVSVALFAASLVGCGEPYREAAVRYHHEAQLVLIARGACGGEQDCQKKELLFWEGGRVGIPLVREGGASLSMYGTNDAALIEAVVERLRIVQRSEHLPGVELVVYSGPHSARGEKVRRVFLRSEGNNGA